MNNRLFPEEFARSDSVIQMTDRRVAPEETNLSQFFEQIGAIKVELGEVSQLLRKLQEANEESKGISSAVAMKALRDRMDADISLVTKIARSLKVKLQELERANTENRKIKWCEEGTATDRTRVTMTSNQRTKLKELMDDFSSLRQKMTGEYKETIERRYYNLTGQHADEDTIENMIQTGGGETFLQKAIQQQGRDHVIDTIKDIQERHDAIKEIEKHLMELHQIFMDIAVLVDVQGDELNDIEANVQRASSFIKEGAKQLATAKRRRRSKRKWCCICTLLLIVLVIVLIVALKIAGVIFV